MPGQSMGTAPDQLSLTDRAVPVVGNATLGRDKPPPARLDCTNTMFRFSPRPLALRNTRQCLEPDQSSPANQKNSMTHLRPQPELFDKEGPTHESEPHPP